MGCGKSKVFIPNSKNGQSKDDLADFYKLGLSAKDIDLLYAAFLKFDVVGDGQVEVLDFKKKLDIQITEFIENILIGIDRDHDGMINFHEFVLGMWNFLARNKESIARFIYEVYNTYGAEGIPHNKVYKLIQSVYGHNSMELYINKAIASMTVTIDKTVTMQLFVDIANKQPALLFPAYDAQERLRRLVVCEAFWEKKAQKSDRVLSRKAVIDMYNIKNIKVSNTSNNNNNKILSNSKSLDVYSNITTATTSTSTSTTTKKQSSLPLRRCSSTSSSTRIGSNRSNAYIVNQCIRPKSSTSTRIVVGTTTSTSDAAAANSSLRKNPSVTGVTNNTSSSSNNTSKKTNNLNVETGYNNNGNNNTSNNNSNTIVNSPNNINNNNNISNISTNQFQTPLNIRHVSAVSRTQQDPSVLTKQPSLRIHTTSINNTSNSNNNNSGSSSSNNNNSVNPTLTLVRQTSLKSIKVVSKKPNLVKAGSQRDFTKRQMHQQTSK